MCCDDPSEFLEILDDFEPCDIDLLMPEPDEIGYIIDHAHDSATGPDGKPYSVYRACKNVSIALILAFLHLLFYTTCDLPELMLASLMVFIPKKVFTIARDGLKIFKLAALAPCHFRLPSQSSSLSP